MCALPVNAVLASVGEMHELSHQDYLHQHAGDAHLSTAPRAAHDDGKNGEGGSLLHVLMHASHCCIATLAIVPAWALPATPLAEARLRRHHDAPAGRALASMPFRPPIAI